MVCCSGSHSFAVLTCTFWHLTWILIDALNDRLMRVQIAIFSAAILMGTYTLCSAWLGIHQLARFLVQRDRSPCRCSPFCQDTKILRIGDRSRQCSPIARNLIWNWMINKVCSVTLGGCTFHTCDNKCWSLPLYAKHFPHCRSGIAWWNRFTALWLTRRLWCFSDVERSRELVENNKTCKRQKCPVMCELLAFAGCKK